MESIPRLGLLGMDGSWPSGQRQVVMLSGLALTSFITETKCLKMPQFVKPVGPAVRARGVIEVAVCRRLVRLLSFLGS